MNRNLCAILMGVAVSGCTLFQPVAANRSEQSAQISLEQVAGLAPGSRVKILRHTPNSRESFVGIVLHASPRGVALLNCIHSVRTEGGVPVLNRTPYLSRLFKVTGVGAEHVPVQWVSIRQITTVNVLEPPPADYVAPKLAIDTNDEPFFERIGIDFNTLAVDAQEPGLTPKGDAPRLVVEPGL